MGNLKSQDLRIGNLIQEKLVGRIGNINAINPDRINVQLKASSFNTTLENIQPITLSEKWLLKFGFYRRHLTKEENQIWRKNYDDGYFNLEQIGESFFWGHPMYSIDCETLHQLQNLYFAITTEELIVFNKYYME